MKRGTGRQTMGGNKVIKDGRRESSWVRYYRMKKECWNGGKELLYVIKRGWHGETSWGQTGNGRFSEVGV